MPPQILRLVLLTAGVIGSYAVARMVMVPATFGEHGPYRGAALGEVASAKPVLSGKKACDECHSEVFEVLGKFKHQSISCESCHGPSRNHATNPDLGTPKGKFVDQDCLRCHEANASRPLWFKQVDPNEHYRGDKHCSVCHVPHKPDEKP